MTLTDHDCRQLAGRWARRWPAAMLRSPYLTEAERAKARRRVANRRRETNDGQRLYTLGEYWRTELTP